jgi:glycine/D-amino acid oxidase-like deaminating enzyme
MGPDIDVLIVGGGIVGLALARAYLSSTDERWCSLSATVGSGAKHRRVTAR